MAEVLYISTTTLEKYFKKINDTLSDFDLKIVRTNNTVFVSGNELNKRKYLNKIIFDEINHGNLSKIFGELFMLIEKDKRGIELQLLYSDENFSVPANVYIIGMMNTADRSLAMLDYALRRRFSFFTMKPGFNTIGFQTYQDSL